MTGLVLSQTDTVRLQQLLSWVRCSQVPHLLELDKITADQKCCVFTISAPVLQLTFVPVKGL